MGEAKASTVSVPHVERTKGEPRGDSLHPLNITKITQINPFIRLFQLTPTSNISSTSSSANTHSLPPSLSFKPGQWLDVHVPGVERAGGFTITSSPSFLSPRPTNPPQFLESIPASKNVTPSDGNFSIPDMTQPENYYEAQNNRSGYLELAIMDSPSNPPAAYLWQPQHQILGTEVKVRVGGSFVWPPPNLSLPSPLAAGTRPLESHGESTVVPPPQIPQQTQLSHVVFVAGGVGINPLMSMISTLVEQKQNREGKLGFKITFLYSTRLPSYEHSNEQNHEHSHRARLSSILFLDRLRDAFEILAEEGNLKVFFTRHHGKDSTSAQDKGADEYEESLRVGLSDVNVQRKRISQSDLLDALGPVEDRPGTACYICGVAGMTDEFVEVAKEAQGMSEGKVLCERWW